MASRKLEDLVPEMQEKAQAVIEYCLNLEVEINIYCTLRSLEEQASLFMQSRTEFEIADKKNRYINRGYTFLADIFDNVPHKIVQLGKHVTNCGPGESFHNYREAWDAAPTTSDGNLDGIANGKIIWDYNKNKADWDIYGQAVVDCGLIWAGNWTSFKELPHAQLREGGNPLKSYTPDKIHEILTQNGLL